MFKNYFKIAFRHLLKNKSFSLLNIFGLALGVAAFIVISLYVNYEKSYDTFDGSENIFRVYMDYIEGGQFVPGDAQTYNLSGPTLKNEFPEIEEQVRLYRLEKVTFISGEKVIEQPNGSLADPTYFDIFKPTLLKGSREDFSKPNTIILTETLSKKIFGNENPIGQTLSVFYGSEGLMEFEAAVPEGIRRGQTLQIRVALSQEKHALLIPKGGFFQETGGNWIFKVSEDGSTAYRADISLGSQNTEYYEVLSGLEPGDKVITSSYDNYGDVQELVLKN